MYKVHTDFGSTSPEINVKPMCNYGHLCIANSNDNDNDSDNNNNNNNNNNKKL